MDSLKALSSLHCELKIMSAKNIQVTNSNGYLFVRCYISTEKNKRVRIDSREISSNEVVSWNEAFALNCIGANQSMDMMIHGKIVLEIRWRSNTISLFSASSSQLLGRAEVCWRDIFDSPKMEMERWVMMKSKKKDVKAPSLRISMKIEVPQSVVLVEKRKNKKGEERCACCHDDCCNNTCVDSELFVIGAALDAF
uniref:uncharacterized protein LOC122580575 n=1 Tax=Erigeron canadensis TaxID=72917 RepID=UPI001CB8B391|nr:uncharacterized protein LOC122580575 [Erigeron canadensis]